MARISVVAVVVVAAAGFRGFGGLAQDCSSLDKLTVVANGEIKPIENISRGMDLKYPSITLYTRQEAAFEGVSVEVHEGGGEGGGGHSHTAWFSGSCFGRDDQWRTMEASVRANEGDHVIEVQTAGCGRRCVLHGVSDNASSYSVVAHGPSQWRKLKNLIPSHCLNTTERLPVNISSPVPTCEIKPKAQENSTEEKEEEKEVDGLSQVVLAVVVAVLLLLLLLLGMIVFYYRRRRRAATRQIQPPTRPEEVDLRPPPAVRAIHTYVDEESPYESLHLDDYYTATAPQDEPLRGPEAPAAAAVTPQDEPPGGSEAPAAATAGPQDKLLGGPVAPAAAAAPAVVSVESMYATVARKR